MHGRRKCKEIKVIFYHYHSEEITVSEGECELRDDDHIIRAYIKNARCMSRRNLYSAAVILLRPIRFAAALQASRARGLLYYASRSASLGSCCRRERKFIIYGRYLKIVITSSDNILAICDAINIKI